jgi:RNA polymerase sigma factor (sigma-70 family)
MRHKNRPLVSKIFIQKANFFWLCQVYFSERQGGEFPLDVKRLKGLRNGDKKEFKSFYDEYVHKALGVAVNITKNKEMAKEAVQEAFIRVYKYIGQYDETKRFDPWFYQIVINECNRLLAKEANITRLNRSIGEGEEFASSEKQHQELKEAISGLHEMYRVPIILKYLRGFTEKEIAEALDANQNTIKTRLKKGKELLRIALDENVRGNLHG